MLDAIEGASPGKARARRVTKSSLARLRVDQLREMAEQLGTDSRGTKDALLERLLGIAGGEAQQQAQAHASAGAAAAAADERVPREG